MSIPKKKKKSPGRPRKTEKLLHVAFYAPGALVEKLQEAQREASYPSLSSYCLSVLAKHVNYERTS